MFIHSHLLNDTTKMTSIKDKIKAAKAAKAKKVEKKKEAEVDAPEDETATGTIA
jgi:hypothetical protein